MEAGNFTSVTKLIVGFLNSEVQKAATYSCDAVMPLVNHVSVILIIEIVSKVSARARCTKHCHKTGVVAALLQIDSTKHNQDQTACNTWRHQFGFYSIFAMSQMQQKHES